MTSTLRADRSYAQDSDPNQASNGWRTAICVFPDAPPEAPRAAPSVSPEDHLDAGVPPASRRIATKVGVSFGTHFIILLVLLLISRSPHFGDVAPGPSTVRFVFAEPPAAPPLASERLNAGPQANPTSEPRSPAKPEPPTSLTPSPQILPHPPAGAPSAPAAIPPLPKVWTPSVQPTPNAPPRASVTPSPAGAPKFDKPVHIDTDWAANVSDWLVQHRTSPTDARLRNVRGIVVIRFNVRPDGQVVDVSVQRSSGNRGLDQAAMAMVRGARLPPFPSSMAQPLQSVTVPIRYDLE